MYVFVSIIVILIYHFFVCVLMRIVQGNFNCQEIVIMQKKTKKQTKKWLYFLCKKKIHLKIFSFDFFGGEMYLYFLVL